MDKGVKCANHARRAATGFCTICGKYVCDACAKESHKDHLKNVKQVGPNGQVNKNAPVNLTVEAPKKEQPAPLKANQAPSKPTNFGGASAGGLPSFDKAKNMFDNGKGIDMSKIQPLASMHGPTQQSSSIFQKQPELGRTEGTVNDGKSSYH